MPPVLDAGVGRKGRMGGDGELKLPSDTQGGSGAAARRWRRGGMSAAMRGRVMAGRPSPVTCPLSTTGLDAKTTKVGFRATS